MSSLISVDNRKTVAGTKVWTIQLSCVESMELLAAATTDLALSNWIDSEFVGSRVPRLNILLARVAVIGKDAIKNWIIDRHAAILPLTGNSRLILHRALQAHK